MDGLIEADQARRRHDAPRRKMSAGASLPRHVAAQGWSVSLGDLLEHLDIQSLIADDSVESNVLLLERLKSLPRSSCRRTGCASGSTSLR